MYRDYFNLRQNPFTTSPDPQFFYLSPGHAESVAKCEYAIRNKGGLAVVYGDIGTCARASMVTTSPSPR